MGGAQETALRACAGLDRSRYRVVLISGSDDAGKGSLFDHASVLEVETKVLRCLHRDIRPLSDLCSLVSLVRLFRRERPTIVHTHSSKAGVIGRLGACTASVPVIVHTVHGWSFRPEHPGPLDRLWVLLERFLARFSSALIVVACNDQKVGLAHGVGRPEQYVVIRSGIDLDQWRDASAERNVVRRELDLPLAAPVVCSVMRLAPPKDPTTLLTAMASIPSAHLLLVGDGPERVAIEQLANRLGMRDRLHVTGSRTDVPRLVGAADVFVLSSRSEGLPRVVLEAMATGVPIVATSVGGVGEAITNEKNGLLVRPGDAAGMAIQIRRLLEDAPLADRCRRAAVTTVAQFSDRSMLTDLAALYERLLRTA